VVVNRNREYFLGPILSYDVFIQEIVNFIGAGQLEIELKFRFLLDLQRLTADNNAVFTDHRVDAGEKPSGAPQLPATKIAVSIVGRWRFFFLPALRQIDYFFGFLS
jgi:hypothetical protein